jgi:hypothetical protein
MNRLDLEFLNGYIKSTLRMSRKILEAKSLQEAKRIAREMEERALRKLDESMKGL